MIELIILYAPFIIWAMIGILAFMGWLILGDEDDE